MSKKIKILIVSLCLALVVSISVGIALFTTGASENSLIRLVSFDYIENTLLGYINDKDNEAANEITILKGQLLEAEREIAELKEQLEVSGDYTSVTIRRGDTLSLKAGCEVIVVSGRLNVVSGQLCDLTVGAEVSEENEMEACHSIVAATDSVICASSSEVIILIRGEYTNG